jgi:cobalt/nickel transport system permease protein
MCKTYGSAGSQAKIRRSFVEKTIDGFSGLLLEDFYAERIAGQAGLMQGLHPGIKVVTTLLLILVAVSLHSWPALLLCNLWAILLATVSNVPLRTFLQRVWLVVPIFTGVIILPSLFNLVHPGDPLLVLYHFGSIHRFGPWQLPSTLAITRQGVAGGVILVLRVGACVSLCVLLTLTTRWGHLLRGLGMVKVPELFIRIMEMTYRYIYVLLNTASEMFMARKSRTVGRSRTLEQQQFVSGALGALWMKSVVLSDEVHAAMIARGYRGTPRTLSNFKIHLLDGCWALLAVAFSLVLLLGDRFVG